MVIRSDSSRAQRYSKIAPCFFNLPKATGLVVLMLWTGQEIRVTDPKR